MGLERVKVVYASAPRGLRVTIPLLQAGAYDVADMTARLKSAGVRDEELPYVVFSPTPPPPPQNAGVLGEMTVPGVMLAAVDSQPKIPIPADADATPPLYSELGPLTSVAVTRTWSQVTRCHYSMRRADDKGYVSVQDLDPSYFQDAVDYDRLYHGRIRLCYGLVWHRVGLNYLKHGDRWDQKVETKHGMSSTNSVSISASVGYSGSGASASISATYGYSITVDDERKVTNEVSVDGQMGESQTAVLWELCRKYVTEVDGILRDESKPFTVVYKDKSGPLMLIDGWGPRYEIVSDEATLKTSTFKA